MRRQAIPLLEHREQSAVERALGWLLRNLGTVALTLSLGVLTGLCLVGILDLIGFW